ncbi:MAG TPA: hypothetical protein VLL25_14080, partial [Acidimicrobiales bacterium]|nr:hypothetical protein [Acidimicrobiales bacterium]
PIRTRCAVRAAAAVALQPVLWPTAARQLAVLARPRWWRRWPPVPLPDAAYLRFRLQVAYGDSTHQPEVGDVVSYLDWCRRMRRLGATCHRGIEAPR